eukprot:2074134-Pleurochrysis_carterae.AAC.1
MNHSAPARTAQAGAVLTVQAKLCMCVRARCAGDFQSVYLHAGLTMRTRVANAYDQSVYLPLASIRTQAYRRTPRASVSARHQSISS